MAAVANREIWEDFIVDDIASDSPLIAAGVVTFDTTGAFADGETFRRMKGIVDLETVAGDEEQITDDPGMELTPVSAQGYKMYAPIVHRGKAIYDTYKRQRDTGVEVIKVYSPQIAAYQRNQSAKALKSCLTGVFDNTAGVLKDSHRGDYRTAQLVLDHVVEQKGLHSAERETAGDNLKLLVVHSNVYTDLVKRSAVTYVAAGDLGMTIFRDGLIPKIGDTMILKDNTLCATLGDNGAGKLMYPSYLFGAGALYLGWQKQMELDDEIVLLKNGKRWNLQWLNSYCPGVPGTSFSTAVENPDNADLATAANYTKVQRDFEINVRQILTRTDELSA